MDETIDLSRIWRHLKKTISRTYWIGILLVLGFSIGQTARAVLTYQPLYQSKLTFSVIKERNGANSFSYNQDATDKLTSSFQSLLTSNVLNHAICQDLNVSTVPASFRIERIGNTNLFSVYANSSHPEDAKDALEALARHYSSLSRVALNDATLTVIESPELATAPYNALNFPRIVLRGILEALVLYAGLAFLSSFFRKRISQSQDIRSYLHSTCLGMVPHLKIPKNAPVPLINSQLGKDMHLRESYHSIRLAVENDIKDKQNKVFLVTSAVPHEGKSTISANLAINLADKGYHVLLLDLDLRNPTQLSRFQLHKKIAPEKVVHIGQMEFAYFSKVTQPSLDLFAGIKGIDQATEVLSNQAIANLIEGFKSCYDVIIVDTPPISFMVDTDIIAHYCDGAMLVIRDDFINIKTAQEAYEALQSGCPNILGCILNQTDRDSIGSYHYSYSSKYGR